MRRECVQSNSGIIGKRQIKRTQDRFGTEFGEPIFESNEWGQMKRAWRFK